MSNQMSIAAILSLNETNSIENDIYSLTLNEYLIFEDYLSSSKV